MTTCHAMSRFVSCSMRPRPFLHAAVVGLVCSSLTASVPVGPPSFANPLDITNAYAPFTPGGMKVFGGHKGHRRSMVVDSFRHATRDFVVDGKTVTTRVLKEIEFADLELVEVSFNYFAQADDGSVYYFGEVVNSYRHGAIVDHDGSWLVGGPTLPSDPPETANAPTPNLFMPANPEVDDEFKPEDLAPIVDETVTITAVNLTVHVPLGDFNGAIRAVETTSLGEPSESKWYVPGIGVVKGRTAGENFALITSTFTSP